MPKDYLDRLMDKKINIYSLYKHFGVYVSEGRNFPCPHHQDTTPSARIFDNHLFCFSERRNYYPSDILKDMSMEEYSKIRAKVKKKFSGEEVKDNTSITKLDITSLERFRVGEESFDFVLTFIGNSSNLIKER